MGETLTGKRDRLNRLAELQNVLDGQKLMLDALDLAHHFIYHSDDDWRTRCDAIAIQVAHELVVTCEGIWELSGPEERAR